MAVQAHWLIQLQSQLPVHDRWLGGDETTILAGLRFAKRRADWRLGRWTAKRALAALFASQDREASGRADELEILAATDGAPEVFAGGQALPLTISLSHCQDVGLCVVAAGSCRIGCDLEAIEPRSERFIDDYFTADEHKWVVGLSESQRPLATTLLWSAKEAALKALRTGLRRDTRSVVVDACDLVASQQWSPLSVCDVPGDAKLDGWWRLMRSFVVVVMGSELLEAPSPLLAATRPDEMVQ